MRSEQIRSDTICDPWIVHPFFDAKVHFAKVKLLAGTVDLLRLGSGLVHEMPQVAVQVFNVFVVHASSDRNCRHLL